VGGGLATAHFSCSRCHSTAVSRTSAIRPPPAVWVAAVRSVLLAMTSGSYPYRSFRSSGSSSVSATQQASHDSQPRPGTSLRPKPASMCHRATALGSYLGFGQTFTVGQSLTRGPQRNAPEKPRQEDVCALSCARQAWRRVPGSRAAGLGNRETIRACYDDVWHSFPSAIANPE